MNAPAVQDMAYDNSAPVARMVAFVRVLRDNAFHIGIAEARDAVRILATPVARQPRHLREALKALCCTTHTDWQ